MPQILSFLPLIFSGIGAGVGLGEAVNGPPQPTAAPTLPQMPTITPQQMQQAQQQTAVVGANNQAATGGAQGLSPSAQASLLDQLYGTPG